MSKRLLLALLLLALPAQAANWNSTSGECLSDNVANLCHASNVCFDKDEAWTTAAIFYVGTTSTADEKALISTWDSSGTNNRQFLLRVDNDAAPHGIEIFMDTGTEVGEVVNVVDDNAWHLVCVTNDGTTPSATAYVWSMDAHPFTFEGSDTFTPTDATSQSTNHFVIGNQNNDCGTGDDYNGNINHVIYIDEEWTQDECLQYGYKSWQVAAARTPKRYFTLEDGDDGTDYSGNGNNLSETGTITDARQPPVGK